MTTRRFILLLILAGVGLLGFGYSEAISTPAIRSAKVAVAGWPPDQPPLRLLLISDIHVAGPDMSPQRLNRIVNEINALTPDLVLIAGDFVSDRRLSTRSYSAREAVMPLHGLRARLGVIAVLGNHDHWRGAADIRSALLQASVRVLDNDAVRVGPLTVGGIDDAFTGFARPASTIQRMRRLGGLKLILTHSPDPFPALPKDAGLVLAGHTHCGQIVLPWIGPLATMSDYGRRYRCGVIRENGKTLIVTAGVGTSIMPIRLGAPPDLWLLQLGPQGTTSASRG
jgi:predicted MPP superfamily phosphohydrolase